MCSFATLTLLGFAHIGVLLVIAFFQGAIAGFSNPGHLALIAKIVPREDLSAVIGPRLADAVLAFFTGQT